MATGFCGRGLREFSHCCTLCSEKPPTQAIFAYQALPAPVSLSGWALWWIKGSVAVWAVGEGVEAGLKQTIFSDAADSIGSITDRTHREVSTKGGQVMEASRGLLCSFYNVIKLI